MQKKKDLIKRYFRNRYSEKDYREIKEKFESVPSDPSFIQKIEKHWNEFNQQEVPDMDMEPLLHFVHHRLFMNEHKKQKQSPILYQLQRIAAILFIPLLIGGLIYIYANNSVYKKQTAWTEIQCPKGTRAHFELPDGSSGYLNSGSSLAYPVPFSGDRQVKLKGEAFFDIAHDKTSPFHVITKNLDIKVLGTRFNVFSFNDVNIEEITLEKGKVEIYNNQGKLISRLAPDQQVNYNRQTGKFTQDQVKASQYISWIEGKLIFRDEPFDQVAKRLSRWYNADVVIADKRLNNYVFHATFINEQLEDVLKLIELTTPVTYQLRERKKSDDGSFGTKRVVLNFSEEKLKEFK